ncbi:hypothetical protein ANN_25454 [Periplaneta americana]|uniref:PiggyBac transposable element-derived protein domain-containing protein n=1 Tax=Periplaneta americana TaxID=6978 RepID=A0ABQ8S1K1_PERAM|nr:hypothetical protein ANN_25454 [Periplaneta americana]
MLGTIRKNKSELPQQMNKKEIHSSSFYFTNDTTVVNCIPKKNKNVVLMSTLHHVNEVSNRNDKKARMILDYNAAKEAVDTLDQVTYTYTCKRKTNRWPVIFFYNILDVSAYNAYVLWTSIDPNRNANKLTRRKLFSEELEKSLTKEHISSRKHFSRTEEAIKLSRTFKTYNCDYSTGIRVYKRKNCKTLRGDDTKDMLLELNDSYEQYGIKMNANKTKTMIIGRKIKKGKLVSRKDTDCVRAIPYEIDQ